MNTADIPIDVFAERFLGLKLHWYQKLYLKMLWRNKATNEGFVFSFDQIVEAVRKVADDQVDDCGFHAAIDVGCELLGISSDKMIGILYKQDNRIE